MGKGDKRSRRGKIFAGTYGKTRPRKKTKKVVNKENNSENKDNA
jgi:30S ribosomal protein S31